MPIESTLLRTQQNDVFAALEQAALKPAEFDWSTKQFTRTHSRGTDTYTISVLRHAQTKYFCEFLPAGLSYSPGKELAEEFLPIVGEWRDVSNALSCWIQYLKRELSAPDPWAELQKNAVDRLSHTQRANAALQSAGKDTAASELREGTADLQKEPPDLTGAIQHSIAALECVAREHCGDHATFGKLLERYPDLFPRPLDIGIEKIWGFASEMGRHLQEGRTPKEEETELLVGLALACCTYLARKIKGGR